MKPGLISMAVGLALVVIGIAFTIISYSVANKGGIYFVAWGSVGVGAIQFVRGLYQLLHYSASTSGRADLRALLWPQGYAGRAVRLAVIAVVGTITWSVLPESWRTASVLPSRVLQATTEIKAIAYSPNGKWIAAGFGFRSPMIWDAETGEAGMPLPVDPKEDEPGFVTAIAFSPDGRLFAATTEKGITIWSSPDWKTSTPVLVGRIKDGYYGLAFSPDGRLLASGSIKAGLLVRTVAGGLTKWRAGEDTVHAVAFAPDGRRMASGHEAGEVKVWDATTDNFAPPLLHTLQVQGVSYPITTLAFLRDGGLASGSYQASDIRIWDGKTGQLLRTLTGPLLTVRRPGTWSIAVSPDGTWIVAGKSDGSLRFWNAASDRPARTIFGHAEDVRAVAFSPDGRWLASGSGDKTVKIWANSQ
jgi:WD40 repeat protein